MDVLAEKIRQALSDDPTLTIDELCTLLDERQEDVVGAIDEYEVVGDEAIHRGPGQGGNWLPPEHQASFAPPTLEELGIEIGFRWPDGSLRAVPFDIEDPEHTTEMASHIGG